MKIITLSKSILAAAIHAAVLLLFGAGVCQAQSSPGAALQAPDIGQADYSLTQVNPDSCVWQNSSGQTVTSIQTGMNFFNGSVWTPSNPSFVPSPDGSKFVASQIQDPTTISAQLNVQGAISVLSPDNVTLRSTPIAISMFDSASGLSAVVATLTNSTGVQVDPQDIVFDRALVGDGFSASVVYSRPDVGSFHQDVVFTGFNPNFNPTNWGFAESSTNTLLIQITTEFYDVPQPLMVTNPIYIEQNPAVRASMASPDLIDYSIDFGDYVFGPGTAYTSAVNGSPSAGVPVIKDFVSDSGRSFLVESVPLSWLLSQLKALPPVAANLSSPSPHSKAKKTMLAAASLLRLPEAKPVPAQKATPPKRLAAAKPHGVVVDYITTVSSTGPTLFAADTTYFVNGNVTCSGPTTMESAVFKFPTNAGSIQINSTLTMSTTNYRPAIFTSADDSTAGASLSSIYTNYTGTPTNNSYGSASGAILLNTTANVNLNNLRICYMSKSMQINPSTYSQIVSVSHAQLVGGTNGIYINGGSGSYGVTLNINNTLMDNIGCPLNVASSAGVTANFCNCTFDTCADLIDPGTGSNIFNFTNSIFFYVSALGTSGLSGANNGFYHSPNFGSAQSTNNTSPFQTNGAGFHYLSPSSSFVTNATTNVGSALLAQLQMKTVFAPLILTNNFTADTTLQPVVPRDLNGTALGWHYDPIDYMTACSISNATLNMIGGVVLAYYNNQGIRLLDYSQLFSQGEADYRNYVAYYGLVQEQPTNYWGVTNAVAQAFPILSLPANAANKPSIFLQTTTFCAPTGETNLLNTGDTGQVISALTLRDCEIYGAGANWIMNESNNTLFIGLTNNVFHRVPFAITNNATIISYNNLFYGTTNANEFTISIQRRTGTSSNIIENNVFDGVTATLAGQAVGYNAYLHGAANTAHTNDIVWTNSFAWVAGPFGAFYQATNSPLLYKGSTTAIDLDLVSYAVTTNSDEGTNTVSLGYHYPSLLQTNGLPGWWCMQYFGTLNVNPFADADGDGLCNLDEFILGLNPTNSHTLSAVHTDAQALVLAYTNDPNCIYHIAISNGPNTNTLLVTMWPTLVGTNYQIYSQASTNVAWIVETNFAGTNSATTVAVYLNGRTLSLIGGYGEDSDGDLLPDGYEVLATETDPFLPDTGLTGTGDAYKDPDSDGWLNIQEYYNRTDPLVFNTPPSPSGLSVSLGVSGTNATINWSASPGATSYTIQRNTGSGFTNLATVSAPQTTYTDTTLTSGVNATYQLVANFALGSSEPGPSVQSIYNPTLDNPFAVVNGPSNALFVVISPPPAGVSKFVINWTADYNGAYYTFDSIAWGQEQFGPAGYFTPSPTSGSFELPLTAFTNGMALIPTSALPLWGSYDLSLQAIGPNGQQGDSVDCGSIPWLIPFIDGSVELKQNLSFTLRIATDQPFEGSMGQINISEEPLYGWAYADNYAYASFIGYLGNVWLGSLNYGIDPFMPFEDNYEYLNFAPSLNNIQFGYYTENGDYAGLTYYQSNLFSAYDYITYSNLALIPNVLAYSNSQWLFDTYFYSLTYDGPLPMNGGISENSSAVLSMTNGARNVYGLPFVSMQWLSTNGSSFVTLSPTNSLNLAGEASPCFAQIQAPALQTVGYYFARTGQLTGDNNGFVYYSQNTYDPFPNSQESTPSFTTTNQTPQFITSVGQSLLIAGYAKQSITNGYTNCFGYLGQYFTNALLVTNGVLTTTIAGIVSEYGNFFPTVPGVVALMTKPDPDQGNLQGECTINVIRLSLDANHDGTMDETFTGPDNTSANYPYVFWANNDFDRYTSGIEDDLQTAPQNDANYTVGGYRAIPCPRDLEDYVRLWVSGVSNTLSHLPTGSTVTLNWGDVGAPNASNPTIDLFQAADADGGIGYLTNLTTSSNQINNTLCQYVGRLGPGSNITLNASTFSNSWAGNHYIFCGVGYGSGTLSLTISNGSGQVLAQSSQYMQIVDIKQMYERWTVGEDSNTPPGAPMATAMLVADGQPRFQYSYDLATDTNDDYIVFVHGWNMPAWEKDRFAETAYKRLYCQGYKGRFGSFRWPCNLFQVSLAQYNLGERTAWQCGQPFETFLAGLNADYPGHVYVLAHSMGNVVTGEALRLAGTNVIVNTYVATQAAISARAYDNTVPADATNSYTPHVYTPDSEGHYFTNGAPPYFNGITGAGTFVDYYNQVDYALGYWVTDQNFKADSTSYLYTTPSSRFPTGYYNRVSFITARSLVFPTNTYEIFSMAAQSYSFALGAETNIASKFPSPKAIDLNAAPYNFGRLRSGHSFQFHSDNMTVGNYWHQLLSSFAITP